MNLLKFMGIYVPDEIKLYEVGKLVGYFKDLERAVESAEKQTGYSEDETLVQEIESISTEMGWVDTRFHELAGEYENLANYASELEMLVDELESELEKRLGDEEREEFEQAQVWEKLNNGPEA